MKRKLSVFVLMLVLVLSGCSILPEDSPIILDGDVIEVTESKPKKGTKKSQETSTQTEEASTEVSSEETTEETTSEEESTETESEEEEENEEWVELPDGGEQNPIGEREVQEEKKQSYLTGQWKDENIVNRRNIAVMIPNGMYAAAGQNAPLLKPYGLSKASIIYEAPVEGRGTALMGIFEDYDNLEMIGPVDSSRDYFIYQSMSFDSIYVNWGMARIWTEELINSNRVDNISAPTGGIAKPCEDVFFRDEMIIPDANKNNNGYISIEMLVKAIEEMGYETDYRESFEQAFLFANDSLAAYEGYPTITKIWPGGTLKNAGGYGNMGDLNPYFEYDPEKHLYYRYQNGDALRDNWNQKKIGVTNVVFKFCHGEERMPDDARYDFLAFGIHGTGECCVFTNGKMIKGTWSKASDPGADYLYDEEGRQIVLNQGKTWICCIWKEFGQFAVYEE